MFRDPDHVTVAVADPEWTTKFFELLGFKKGHVAVIDGDAPATSMGMPDMKAEHIRWCWRVHAPLRDPVAGVRSGSGRRCG